MNLSQALNQALTFISEDELKHVFNSLDEDTKKQII